MSATKADRWSKIRTPQVNDASKQSKEQIVDSLTQPVPPKHEAADGKPEDTNTSSDSKTDGLLPTAPVPQDQSSTSSISRSVPSTESGEIDNRANPSNTTNSKPSNSEIATELEESDTTVITQNPNNLSSSNSNAIFPSEMLSRFEELFKGAYHGSPDSDLLVEEAYTRITFLIENELLHEFDKVASNERRGFIKQLVNTSLRMGLDMYAEWHSQQPKKLTKRTTPRPRRRGGR